MKAEYVQLCNPTNEERHKMIRILLQKENRIEDYYNIISLLSPPKDISAIMEPGQGKGVSIGIIGGGLAGLASAYELRKLGFDITILERQTRRIGGRVYTYYFDNHNYGELGAMRIPVSHETTWHYINLFGLDTSPFVQTNKNAFIYVRNKLVRNDPEGINVMKEIYPEFNLYPWERRLSWQKLIEYSLGTQLLTLNPSIRKEILQIKREYSIPIDYLGSQSIRQVMEAMGLSKGAVELLSCVAPFSGYAYYNSFFELLREQYTVDYGYRYEIDGGMVKLPHSLFSSLLSKKTSYYKGIKETALGSICWKNGKSVTGIYKAGANSKIILEYKDEKNLEMQYEDFDYVICAIPFSSLRNINIYPMFSTEKMQAIKEMNYIAAQKTIIMCSNRFWEKGNESQRIIGGGSYTDLPVGSIWYPNYSGSCSYNRNSVLLASYNLNQDAVRLGNLDEKLRFAEIKKQVAAVNGLSLDYLDSIAEAYKTVQWNTEEGFYGGFCYYMPEQQRLFAYAAAKPEYENRVYFAGEHVSLAHAWMQGALHSAMKAANAVAYHYREVCQ